MKSDNIQITLPLFTLTKCKNEQNINIYNLNNQLHYTMDNNLNGSICKLNCSGHGDCLDGVCFCEVEYSGGACDNPNFGYFFAFSTVFYIICLVSIIQLILCINTDFKRQKPRSIWKAFRITTQKALYFFISVATALRGFYFSSPETLSGKWLDSLMSAYYPVILSGSSLLVCFWAEVFHLHDVSVERPGFLSKSFTGFLLFNVISYSLLLTEWVLLQFSDTSDDKRTFFLSVFNSIYAILMMVVIVFLLIYGVEVYFKVRGAFIQGENCSADNSQLKQSRFGLISQVLLLSITVVFIFSDVLGGLWKEKVPVISRNTHQIMFRIVELAVALWYPCAFWNCVRPERLWTLNPRRILKHDTGDGIESTIDYQSPLFEDNQPSTSPKLSDSRQTVSTRSLPECWICYDSERTDAGPLLQPCGCKGDVSVVHHECLKQWLIESHSKPELIKCNVCQETYKVQRGKIWLPAGLTISRCFQTAAIISIMCSAAVFVYLMINIFTHIYVRTISVGCAILIEYICLRFLGVNFLSAYHRATFRAINISGRQITINEKELPCSSQMIIINENLTKCDQKDKHDCSVKKILLPTTSTNIDGNDIDNDI